MQIEEWKEIDVKGYFVSNLGRIKGPRGRIKKPSITRKGYSIIRIPNKNYAKSLHRVIAGIFMGKSELQVNHKDGDKTNNSVDNLEYLSCKDNIQHAIKNGLRTADQNLKSKSIFDTIQLQVIRDCFTAGFGNQDISKYFKCHHSTISKIRTGVHYPL